MDGRAVDLDHRLDYELTNEIWFPRSSNRCVASNSVAAMPTQATRDPSPGAVLFAYRLIAPIRKDPLRDGVATEESFSGRR